MKEKTFEELFYDRIGNFDTEHHELIEKWEFIKFLQQVREATKREAVSINDEVILFNMGVDLESDIEFRDVNAEILNLPTDRIKIEE